jgi:hypothetical protein
MIIKVRRLILGGLSIVALTAAVCAGSQAASANVPGPPSITNGFAPTVQSVAPGQPANFEATAYANVSPSSPHGTVWQVSADRGVTWTTMAAADGAVTDCGVPGESYVCTHLSFTATLAENHNLYRGLWGYLICDPSCHWLTHTSLAAVLFVGTGERTVTITANPADVTVGPGQAARFTAQATGNPAPVVQWYQVLVGSDQFTAVNLPTARARTLVVPAANVVNGTRYEAFFLTWLGAGTPYQSPSSATTTLASLTLTG